MRRDLPLGDIDAHPASIQVRDETYGEIELWEEAVIRLQKRGKRRRFWNYIKKGFKTLSGKKTTGTEGESDVAQGVNPGPGDLSGMTPEQATEFEKDKPENPDPSQLRRLWEQVKGQDSIKSGKNAVTFSFDVAKADAKSLTELYGCTGIVVFNGQDGIIGHFCEEVEKIEGIKEGGKVLTDELLAEEYIIGPMTTALASLDVNDHTHAWIAYNRVYREDSVGLTELTTLLTTSGIPAPRIHLEQYQNTQGSYYTTRASRGPAGKLLIKWDPNGNDRARFRLWIEKETPVWDKNYNACGNEVP